MGLDSTKDGSYLVATTANYLMVYKTAVGNVNGYLTSLKKLKLKPAKIELSEEIINKYNLHDLTFTKAKFDNPYESEEKYIISTVGQCLLMWSIEDIFNGNTEPKVFIFIKS